MVAFGFMKQNSVQRRAKKQSIKDGRLSSWDHLGSVNSIFFSSEMDLHSSRKCVCVCV